MSVTDWDGTTSSKIAKIFDWDGTTSSYHKRAFDWDGTTSTTVYESDITLFSSGATSDSGTWSGYRAYLGTAPTIGTTISYPSMSNNSYFGSLASTANAITFPGSCTLSFDMTKCSYTLPDTNLAINAKWGVRIYALFSTSKITLNTGTIDTITWAESFSKYAKAIDGYKTYTGAATNTGSIAAGTKTVSLNLSGNYYFGLLVAGYDAKITSAFTINNIVIS